MRACVPVIQHVGQCVAWHMYKQNYSATASKRTQKATCAAKWMFVPTECAARTKVHTGTWR